MNKLENRILVEAHRPNSSDCLSKFWVWGPKPGQGPADAKYLERFRGEAKILARKNGRTLPKNFKLRLARAY